MSQVIWGQVLFVLATLCNGMLLMTGYDVLRLFRWLIPHGKLFLWVEDTLYWCLAALPTFYLFFSYNEGVIRWYGLLGILLGAVLYETGISLPIRIKLGRYADRIRRRLGKVFRTVCRFCGKPFRLLKKKMEDKRRKKAEKKKENKKENSTAPNNKIKNKINKKNRGKGLHK